MATNMMRMKHIFWMAVAASALSIQMVSAQYAVYPASQRLEKPGENALFYSLPQNSYLLTVEIEETVLTRGIYSDYAEKLLKLPAIKENSSSYRIKDVKIKTLAHPDPQQIYGVQGNRIPALRLTPEGILIGVNTPMAFDKHKPDNKPEERRHPDMPENQEPRADAPLATALPVADLNIRQKFDTIIRQHQTDTTTVIEKILRPVVDEKSLAEQARKMADQILKLQADKAELLSGLQEVAYPAGTMEFMYRQMERNERRYLDCFTGTMQTRSLSYTFMVDVKGKNNIYPIAYFYPESGIEKLYAEENTDAQSEDLLVLELSPLPCGGAAAVEFQKANTDKSKNGGFYYRLPCKATARILLNGEEITNKEVFVSQWGQTLQLPVRDNYVLRLDKHSGGLLFFGPAPDKNTANTSKH